MSTFWMWFVRPFAEFLAVVVVLLVIGACTALALWVDSRRARRKGAKR